MHKSRSRPCRKVLSPSGAAPGRLICDALAGWLDGFPEISQPTIGGPPPNRAADAFGQPATGAFTGPAASLMPAKNPSRRETAGSALKTAPPPPEPAALRGEPPASQPNGHGRYPSPPPGRLPVAEPERLAAALELDPQGLRRGARVAAELAQKAVAGAILPGEALVRLRGFLTAG